MMTVNDQKKTSSSSLESEDFLDYAEQHDFGELHFKVDKASGMKAIIAIHNTKRGPALGGCRFIEYPSTHDAITDAMRLARGMSYKAASVNLPLGGGKSVIIKPKTPFNREAYLDVFGQFVNDLGGRYITALDSGTELPDMDRIAQHTPYVASLSHYQGDPAPYTARGIQRGIEAAVAFKLGKDSLEGVHIAIQGLGHVGAQLAASLHAAGARLSVADINPAAVNEAVLRFGATAVDSSRIHAIECDVFAPCALGAVLNTQSIDQLQTTVIAGAANNQLAHRHDGKVLHEKGILYTPDYVINAGGLIFAASKYLHAHEETILQQVDDIKTILLEIFKRSEQTHQPTSEVADRLAEEKLGIV